MIDESHVETSTGLQKRLEAKGDSLHSFAKRHEYKYRTVCIVAQRWWHRHDRKPHGGLSKEILAKMQSEFCHD